jgi:hypothetical protein
MLVIATLHNGAQKWVVKGNKAPKGYIIMNTQSAIIVSTVAADTVSADAKSLSLRLSSALSKGDTAATTVRAVMWDVVDAARADTVSADEAVAVLDLYVVARIAENSRAKYRQRAGMVLTLAADATAEKRETRDPLSYAASLVRAEEKAAKDAKEAADTVAATLAFEAEAVAIVSDGDETKADSVKWRAENAAEIASLAATLAAEKASGAALDAALKAAIAAGMTRERVAAFVAAAFA